jgi:hypothetical protein
VKKINNTRKVIFSLLLIFIIIISLFFISKSDQLNSFYSFSSDSFKNKNEVIIIKKQVNFLYFKKKNKLELWLNSDTGVILVKYYDINIMNNEIGPKILNNSSIFPEGIYSVTEYDENNLKISFPNEFDKIKAKADNRSLIEQDILFGISSENGNFSLKKEHFEYFSELIKTENVENIRFISSPIDFRKTSFLSSCNHCPHWANELYSQIELELNHFIIEKK